MPEPGSGVTWPDSKRCEVDSKFSILLASINWSRPKDPRTPLGTAYLYSWLVTRPDLRDSLRIGFADYTVNDPLRRIVDDLLVASPSLLGLGVYVWNTTMVRAILADLRARGYGGTIVLGGPEISYGSTELVSEFPEADFYVKGEGEIALEEIVRAIIWRRIPRGPGIFGRLSESCDTQAHMPLGIDPVQPQSIPALLPLIVKHGFGRVEFQRGCIFGCSFCAFPFKDRVFRQLNLTNLRSDLAKLREFGVKELAVLDPIFFIDKGRAMTVLRALHDELPGVRLEIQSRLEHLDDALIEQLSSMNVLLECGVQSLDSFVQKSIRRGGDPRVIQESLQRLRDSRVDFETHLIFGLPFQSLDSVLRDVEYLAQFQPRRLRLFPLLDHRGTELSELTRTVYRARLKFSEEFPRQVEETAWISRNQVRRLTEFYELFDAAQDWNETERAARTIVSCFRQEKGVEGPSGSAATTSPNRRTAEVRDEPAVRAAG